MQLDLEKKKEHYAEVIQKWALNEIIQCQWLPGTDESAWIDYLDFEHPPLFADFYDFRVKPKTLTYRVALFKNDSRYWTECFNGNSLPSSLPSSMKYFVSWVSDSITIELPVTQDYTVVSTDHGFLRVFVDH